MNRRVLFFSLLVFFSQRAYAFSSYRLLKNSQGNYVLILGEIHNTLANPVRTDIKTFIEAFMQHELSKPIPCVIELGEKAQSLFVTGQEPQGITVGKTFVQLARSALTYKEPLASRLTFIPYDPREYESDIINSITGTLSLVIKNFLYTHTPFPTRAEWEATKQRAQLEDRDPFLLSDYFKKLQDYLIHIIHAKDTFAQNMPYLPLFQLSLISLGPAIRQAIQLFNGIDDNMRLEGAILKLFDGCITAEQAWERYKHITSLLLEAIDKPYAQIMFLGKILELLCSSRKVIVILSEDLASKLAQFLQCASYKLLREEAIFKEADKHTQALSFAAYNGRQTDVEKLFSFSTRLKDELEVFLEKQFPCTTCQKRGKTQLCDGCRTTYYCSKECQKADWQAHKLMCKK